MEEKMGWFIVGWFIVGWFIVGCGKIPTQAKSGLEWGTHVGWGTHIERAAQSHGDAVVVFGEAGFCELEFEFA